MVDTFILTDQEIISGLKQQSEKAFAVLVEKWQHVIFNTALGILQNEADADDVAQEVFIKVYRSVGDFKGNAALGTWLYRITVNTSLDFLKATKRRQHWLIPGWFAVKERDDSAIEFNHPGVALDRKEDAAILFRAIRELPQKQQTAFVLQKLEGLPVQQIAEIMEMSTTAIESLLSRAKKGLRQKIGKMFYG